MEQLETALLASNYDGIDKYATKLRKKKEISTAMETVLHGYVAIHRNIRLHAASLELDLSHLIAYQITTECGRKMVESVRRAVADCNGSDLELKLAHILSGIVSLFLFDKDSLVDALASFEKVDFDLTKRFLLYELSDTEIVQSSMLEKVFGILGLYFYGIALELHGSKEDASVKHQTITEFLFRYRQAQLTGSKASHDFICGALYRGGLLLKQQGRPMEAATILRSFLSFYQVNPPGQKKQPVNATVRLVRSISLYVGLLDGHFRRFNFKSFCDDGQYPISGRDLSQLWQSESVKEEIILCVMLMESLELNEQMRRDLDDLRLDANNIRRLARIGYLDGIVKLHKTRFQTTVSDVSLYRNLFHSLMSAGKHEEAVLAGRMYLRSKGDNVFSLLLLVKLYLALPSKTDEAFTILAGIDGEQLDRRMQVPYFVLRGLHFLSKARRTRLEDSTLYDCAREEFKLAQQVDERNEEALYFQSLIAAETGNGDEAERLVKRALTLNSGDARAWALLALLKSAKRDYEGCLAICTTELANMLVKDVNLSLIRVSALLALNRSEEALEVLKRIISAHFRKSSDIRMDGGLTVVSEETFSPGSFLSKFLGDQGSVYEFEASFMDDSAKITSFAEYTQAFPASVDEYVSAKNNDGYPIPRSVLTLADQRELAFDRVIGGMSQTPSNVLASSLWLEVSRVYLQEGLFADAEAAASQAHKNNEVFAPIFATFGLVDEAQGRIDSAIVFYRRGLRVDGEDVECLLGLARCLLHAKMADEHIFEAESSLRRILVLDRSRAETWSLLGRICARTGRIREAQMHFERAMSLETCCPLRSYRMLPLIQLQ